MYRQVLLVVAGWAAIAGSAHGQALERTATFLGGGSPDRGKCTIEVVVDTAAEVEIRGDRAILRNVAGQPPQWRRFECTGALPRNPADFRFAGVDGRGRQSLARDPRNNGGAAVIRIEDTAGGSEGYTFDIFWGGYTQGPIRNDQGGGPYGGGPGPGPIGNDQGGGRYGGGPGRRFTAQQAVQVCESSIRQQAEQRFRTPNIDFRGTAMDDNPGRQDWVIGVFDVRRPAGRDEAYRFSCSVNFDTGLVRSAEIGTMERFARGGQGRRFTTQQAAQVCESSIRQQAQQRFRTPNINFRGTALDDNPGRQDWVMGVFDVRRANGRDETYNFSCSVNFDTGQVRSAQIGTMERLARGGPGRRFTTQQAVQVCESSIRQQAQQRFRTDSINFRGTNLDNNPGRQDWVMGMFDVSRATGRQETYGFSCSVNFDTGQVRSAQIEANASYR